MMLMILSDPYVISFNDLGGSMSRGNIEPKPYLTNTGTRIGPCAPRVARGRSNRCNRNSSQNFSGVGWILNTRR